MTHLIETVCFPAKAWLCWRVIHSNRGTLTRCGSGTAPLGRWCRVLWHPTDVVECSAQDHFDLAVEAAEFLVCPPGECVVDSRVDPEQDLSAVAHV